MGFSIARFHAWIAGAGCLRRGDGDKEGPALLTERHGSLLGEENVWEGIIPGRQLSVIRTELQ